MANVDVQTSLSQLSVETLGVYSQLIDWGVATSAGAAGCNAIVDNSKSWGTDVHKYKLVKIIGGQGKGQASFIIGNSDKTLVVSPVLPIGVGGTSIYAIYGMNELQVLKDMFGGGNVISSANPLPVDVSPGNKTSQRVMNLATLAAASVSLLSDCTTINLVNGPSFFLLQFGCTYNAGAAAGATLHVRASIDGVNFDSIDWDTFIVNFTAGTTVLQSIGPYETDPMYVKVLVENMDAAQAITGITLNVIM